MTTVLNVLDFGQFQDLAQPFNKALSAASKISNKNHSVEIFIPTGEYELSTLSIENINNLVIHFGPNCNIRALDKGKWNWNGQIFSGWLNVVNCNQIEIWGEDRSSIDGAGSTWWPKSSSKEKQCKIRPTMIIINQCTQLTFRNLSISNSPYYHLRVIDSNHLKFLNLNINSPSTSPNTDGINIYGGSTDVEIAHCMVHNGDDAFAVNAFKKPCSQISIHDCVLSAGHGASIGSAINNQIENISFENLQISNTRWGLRIKSIGGKVGKVNQVTFSNIQLNNITENPILLTTYYKKDNPNPSTIFTNITYSNISSSKSGLDAGFRVVKPVIQVPSPIVLNNVVLNNVSKKVTDNNVPLTWN